MKTIIKIAGKLVKMYLKATLWLWAFVGVSVYVKELTDQKKAGYATNIEDANLAAFDKACDNYKEYWKCC